MAILKEKEYNYLKLVNYSEKRGSEFYEVETIHERTEMSSKHGMMSAHFSSKITKSAYLYRIHKIGKPVQEKSTCDIIIIYHEGIVSVNLPRRREALRY